jgi:hypothetical protein
VPAPAPAADNAATAPSSAAGAAAAASDATCEEADAGRKRKRAEATDAPPRKWKGVSWHKTNRTWRAIATDYGTKSGAGYKLKTLGQFAVQEEAARAYDAFVRSPAQVKARLAARRPAAVYFNFPQVGTDEKQARAFSYMPLGRTGLRGVKETRVGRFQAAWHCSDIKKSVHLGTFATAEAAARAYDKNLLSVGKPAVNFPGAAARNTSSESE